MTDLVAKAIIKNQYWVVIDGDKKVGNVQASDSGYEVTINGHLHKFNNFSDVAKNTNINFQRIRTVKTKPELPYPEYPTTKRTYNNTYDIKRKLHIFTKGKKSKCYYAAGWFVINHGDNNELIFCPKYLMIQRYAYQGPFTTKEEALQSINNT